MSEAQEFLEGRNLRRASCWRLRTRLMKLPRRGVVMGILNVTPDSFSDGGRFFDAPAAIDHALRLVEEGADILDIGGESTRPNAEVVSENEELRRTLPVIEALSTQTKVPISIDTSKSKVASAALAAGAEIINDVTGLQGDPDMLPLAAKTQAGVCAMHMRGTPRTMQDRPAYEDVVSEVSQYLQSRRDALMEAGIAADRICLDPGIGFGKTAKHNFALLANCWQLHRLGCPLLVGLSRKGFLAKVSPGEDSDRVAASIGGALSLAAQGVQVLRVHDVRQTHEALLAFEASGGLDALSETLAE